MTIETTALLADSGSTTIDVDRIWSEQVAALAMSLDRVDSAWAVAARPVQSAGNGVQMAGADTARTLAEVIDLEPIRDRADQTDVRPAVDVLLWDEFPFDLPVPVPVLRTTPDPALIVNDRMIYEPLLVIDLICNSTSHGVMVHN